MYALDHIFICTAPGAPLDEPELFFLSFAQAPKNAPRERRPPLVHPVGVRTLTSVHITLPAAASLSRAARAAEATGAVRFRRGSAHELGLEFDRGVRGHVHDLRPDLPLLLRL